MPTAFTRTMRGLQQDGFSRSAWGLVVASFLLGLWGLWAVYGRVTRYEATDVARLEVDRATHVIQALTSGRIAVSNLVLGQEVREGDVLVELDANPEGF